MSLVDPRPALLSQGKLIVFRTASGVDAMLPGPTGSAQINGRDEVAIREKVRLEAEDLRRRSLTFDLKIILLTAVKVKGGQVRCPLSVARSPC